MRKIIGTYDTETIGSIRVADNMTDSYLKTVQKIAYRVIRQANEQEWKEQVIKNGGTIPDHDRTGANYYEVEILD